MYSFPKAQYNINKQYSADVRLLVYAVVAVAAATFQRWLLGYSKVKPTATTTQKIAMYELATNGEKLQTPVTMIHQAYFSKVYGLDFRLF